MTVTRRFAPCPNCCRQCTLCPTGTPDEIEFTIGNYGTSYDPAVDIYGGSYLCTKTGQCQWQFVRESAPQCSVEFVLAQLFQYWGTPTYPAAGYRLFWQVLVYLAGFGDTQNFGPWSHPLIGVDDYGTWDAGTGIYTCHPTVVPDGVAGCTVCMDYGTAATNWPHGRLLSMDPMARTLTLDLPTFCGTWPAIGATKHRILTSPTFRQRHISQPFYWGQSETVWDCTSFFLYLDGPGSDAQGLPRPYPPSLSVRSVPPP